MKIAEVRITIHVELVDDLDDDILDRIETDIQEEISFLPQRSNAL